MLLCHARLHDEIATVEKARFLERRSFIMTYYVGVDVAKFEHVASILDSKTGELVLDSFHFENSIADSRPPRHRRRSSRHRRTSPSR